LFFNSQDLVCNFISFYDLYRGSLLLDSLFSTTACLCVACLRADTHRQARRQAFFAQMLAAGVEDRKWTSNIEHRTSNIEYWMEKGRNRNSPLLFMGCFLVWF